MLHAQEWIDDSDCPTIMCTGSTQPREACADRAGRGFACRSWVQARTMVIVTRLGGLHLVGQCREERLFHGEDPQPEARQQRLQTVAHALHEHLCHMAHMPTIGQWGPRGWGPMRWVMCHVRLTWATDVFTGTAASEPR